VYWYSQPELPSLALTRPVTDLEEFEFRGTFHYLEALAVRVGAPSPKKLSISLQRSC
jgi:hypothetical protein